MPNMTNAKSADVLDVADAFEDKLNWQLFKAEQDARLFAPPTHPNEWVPGKHLYLYPENGILFEEFRGVSPGVDPAESDGEEHFGYRGNYVRPMLSIQSDVYREDEDRDNPGYVRIVLKYVYRCEPCEVSWRGPEPCFNCGEHRDDMGFYGSGKTSGVCDCPSCQTVSLPRNDPPYRGSSVSRTQYVEADMRATLGLYYGAETVDVETRGFPYELTQAETVGEMEEQQR